MGYASRVPYVLRVEPVGLTGGTDEVDTLSPAEGPDGRDDEVSGLVVFLLSAISEQDVSATRLSTGNR